MSFKVDDKVIINRDVANVPAGTVGTIYCIYETEPLSYEVLFFEFSTDEISIYLENDELEPYN